MGTDKLKFWPEDGEDYIEDYKSSRRNACTKFRQCHPESHAANMAKNDRPPYGANPESVSSH